MKQNLILVRGIPGSGKSTFAKHISKNGIIFEADMFFLDNGEYKFDISKIHLAHRWCFKNVEKALESGCEEVIVSNTFVKESQLNRYIKLGKKYNCIITSIIVETRHDGTSVHNVPEETIIDMKTKFAINL